MKKIIILSLSLFAFIASTVLVGCKNDPCKDITCAFSGTCAEGGCICQVGYEGVHCETAMRDKFVGIYNVNENGSISPNDQFPAVVSKDAASLHVNEVHLINFQNNFLQPILATVKHDTITIPNQIVDGRTVEGWGHITGTNPLDQHYYQHATILFYYFIKDNTTGLVNKYGYPDLGEPSNWAK
jgi:hypothetical protein